MPASWCSILSWLPHQFLRGLMSAAHSWQRRLTIKLSAETHSGSTEGNLQPLTHMYLCIDIKISRYLHTCRYSKGVKRWYMYLIFVAPRAGYWVLRVAQWAIVWNHVWFAEHTINKAAARWSCNALKLGGSQVESGGGSSSCSDGLELTVIKKWNEILDDQYSQYKLQCANYSSGRIILTTAANDPSVFTITEKGC